MKTTLVILAAGLGSRFGKGVKQIAPVGPNGEIIIDYSIHDAIEAGFDKVVFIIRKNIEEAFHAAIGDRISKKIEIAYAYQELDMLPEGFSAGERTKPWGTGHAILVCKDVIDTPFAVINADDYYGKHGLKLVHDYLVREPAYVGDKLNICMAGYLLNNTLSENGAVTRGVCHSKNGLLTSIAETKNIYKVEGRAALKDGDKADFFPDDTLCSMNLWGYPLEFIDTLEEDFRRFLTGLAPDDLTAEYLLPTIVGDYIDRGLAEVSVLPTDDKWFGMTYQEDKFSTRKAFEELIREGVYPKDLTV